jgi:hypothetical protein
VSDLIPTPADHHPSAEPSAVPAKFTLLDRSLPAKVQDEEMGSVVRDRRLPRLSFLLVDGTLPVDGTRFQSPFGSTSSTIAPPAG